MHIAVVWLFLQSGQGAVSNRGGALILSVTWLEPWATRKFDMGTSDLARHPRIRLGCEVLVFLILCSAPLLAQNSKPSDPQPSVTVPSPGYVPVRAFNPSRNAAQDIEQAVAEAQRTGKRIILEIGGDWCPWCHALDQFFQGHHDLLELRDDNFIVVPIYYDSENKNEQALSKYSKILGIPHMFVLEKDGTLLHSQHVVELETSNSYEAEKIREFLTKWSPHSELTSKADAKTTSQLN